MIMNKIGEVIFLEIVEVLYLLGINLREMLD